MEGTDSLRELAPRWSLAGDERLLDLLQNTHQRIVLKCREVNTKLGEMATALDSASINLQNVNNRFMALSNSQFIESRVYDDDADLTAETKPIEKPPTPEVVDELTSMKRSLAVLDGAHELTEILDDSDTDDSDAQISVVLKPKDAYAHRPLPYIIGSQAWKNKWHAGLVVEDSDSDSVTSKPGVMMEEYSDSEEEIQNKAPDATISETSSSFHSERDRELVPEKQTPAAVAADLAARLGNAPPRVLEEPEDLPQSTPKPVYRPHKPVPSTIFSDEPPPLDYQDQYSDTQDDDIFAEINKNQPYNDSNTGQDRLADDLFGNPVDDAYKKEQRSIKQKSTLFDDDSEPELFVDKPKTLPKEGSRSILNEDNSKKPVGGISLFGSNKGTESIGAAILKRNQRKSFSSDDESDEDSKNNIKNDTADEYVDTNNANYIFDNLFAKAKQAEQKMAKQVDKPVKEKPKPKVKEIVKPKEVIKKPEPKEIKDLFSDNIFDDIDDIFTSNIKIPTKEASKNAKSIFDDDDDDDLFSDIAKTPKETTKATSSSSNKKSIFDSDDDLFSDVKVTKDIKTDIVKEKAIESNETESQISKTIETNNNSTKLTKETSIFDDSKQVESKMKPKAKSRSIFDSDSDDELFSDVKVKTSKSEKVEKSKTKPSDTESELFKVKETKVKNETAIEVDTLKTEKSKVFQSPSLFEEDEIDDLFINDNKAKIANLTDNDAIEHKIPENLPDIVNENEMTEGSLDLNVKKDKRSDLDEKVIENKSLDVVDTKPEEIDEINASSEFNGEETVVNNKNVIENVKDKESSPVNIQKINSSGIDPTLQETGENTDFKTKSNVSHKEQVIFSDKETPKLKIDEENTVKVNEKQDEDRKEVKEKEDVLTQQKNEIPIATFKDIITEPPAFEKTKEVKKTLNVNALFEDDSDDEALFFKKNDVISDEKPDIFSTSANFGLFNDEPPAFVDFAPKSEKKYDDLFSFIPKEDANFLKQSDEEWHDDPKDDRSIPPKLNQDDDTFGSPETIGDTKTTKSVTNILSKEIPDSDEELFSSITKNDPIPKSELTKESIDQLDDIKQDKKIGKLNTKNFNINVQALVPGASPKKIPKDFNENTKITHIDNTTKERDAQITKDNEPDNAEPKTLKSISFENKPASGVLDNNLSKQRPRIQVKRRPSSRKARHEAVRKSVIDLDDDTDNSSSFDEPLPKLNQNKSHEHKNQHQINQSKDSFTDGFSSFDESLPAKQEMSIESNEHKDQDQIAKSTDKLFDDLGIFDEPSPANQDKSKESQKNLDDTLKTSTIDDVLQESRDTNLNTSKKDKLSTEYESNMHKNDVSNDDNTLPKVNIDQLLNSDDKLKKEINEDVNKSIDEVDTNEAKVLNEERQSTTKVKYILNDEDIFSKSPKDDNFLKNTESDDDLFKNKGIKNIGNTYKVKQKETIQQESNSKSITQSNNSTSKTVQPKKQSKSLFDLSDDDDDLFGKGNKTKKVEVKSKLFDSDSEDDLFSGKKNVKEKEFKKVKEVKVGGSLFGDDDNDLFGAKSKKTTIATTKTSASTSRSVSKDTKSTEVVFDDPLSMLDGD